MSRWGPSVDGSLATLAVVTAGVIALSVVALQSGPTGTAALTPQGGIVDTQGKGTATTPPGTIVNGKNGQQTTVTTPGQKGGGGTTTTVSGPATSASCNSTNNGGSTDRGVTATRIKFGATVVQSGIGASFLGPVRVGINAVADEVKRTGGICGRTFDMHLIDDGWDSQRGLQFIQNLVQDEKVFALAVDPSSEGLRLASQQGYLGKTRTPVVGSDGMLNDQYLDPWVWPIAASTVSTMHIMASDACTRLHKHQFGIVFDSRYRFGVEGAYAFNAAVKRCTGENIPGYFDPRHGTGGCSSRFCAISAGQTSYDTENKTFNDQCTTAAGGRPVCDFVAFLLEPNEAQNFLRNGTGSVRYDKGMAQTLFTRDFARNCGSSCDGAMVWTGFNPPIEEFGALAPVRQYLSVVRAASPDVDVLNQFLEGGYDGMQMLVEALKRVGPNLTRDRLKAVLDSMDFDNGLTTPLRWRSGAHFANAAMHAFAIQYKGSFNGFRNVTGWIRDPYLGQDVK